MSEFNSPIERRAQATAMIVAQTGIDEVMIENLVYRFYEKVREEPVLGPVFETRIDDWETHLQRMCAFWSSVALMTGRYHGNPMIKHLPLPIDANYFDIWLNLFEKTAEEVCPPPAATHFIERARRIAESLEIGVASQQGVMLARGQRFHNERLHQNDTEEPR